MKNLNIKCSSMRIEKGNQSFKVNKVALEELIATNLPKEMENYEPYIADIDISIKIHDSDVEIFKDYEEEELADDKETSIS